MDLVSAFSAIFDTNTGDLRIIVKAETGNEAQATFSVISQILTTRSEVFDRMLTHDMKEAATKEVIIQGFSPDAVSAFLRFLYTDQLAVSAALAVEVQALADKYQVGSLVQKAATLVSGKLNSENACEVFRMAKKMGAASTASKVMSTLACSAKEFLPKAFVWDTNFLHEVLSNPQLCITDFELAKVLIAWQGNPAAKHHGVEALLAKYVQLSAVSEEQKSQLEVMGRDVGLEDKLKELRRSAKRGTRTTNVFSTLNDHYLREFPDSSSRPPFIGYWIVCIPSSASFCKGRETNGENTKQLAVVARGCDDFTLNANESLEWFMPHHALFMTGVSFSRTAPAPEVSVSTDGVTWAVVFDTRHYEGRTTTEVRACHFEQSVKWFRLRARTSSFYGNARFHGILVTT